MVGAVDSPTVCLDASQTKRRSDRTNGVTKHDKPSQALRRMAVTLPPPIQDHLIELLAHRFHVRIGESSVQRAHVVGVRARAADCIVK